MPIKQITPRQFLRIRKDKVLFSISICFLIISLASLIIFLANIKSKTTKTGEKIYAKNSKIPLYVSLLFSLLSLFLFFSIILAYNKIFSFQKSPILTICFILTGLSFIILVIDIIFMAKNFNVCPDGKEYNNDVDQCVPICPDGYYLDTNLLCVRGCQTEKDCPNNTECINGTCCDLDNHKVIDGICCPKDYVHEEEGEASFCCSQPLCEGNGKKICCNGDNLKCEVSSSTGDPRCVIKCGTEECKEGEYCLSYPASLDDPKSTGKMYKCSGGANTCGKTSGTYYYPNPSGNFYPAYNDLIDSPPDLNQFLDNTPLSDSYKNVIKTYTDQQDNLGYISGLQNAIQFQTDQYGNNCNIETCLTNVQFPYTKQLNIVEDDGNLYCNQYKTFEADISGNKDDKDDSYYSTETVEESGKGIFTLSSEKKNFPTDPPQTQKENKVKSNTVCGKQNYYSSDSSDFDDCSDNECPFEDSSKICKKDGDVRYIQKKPQAKYKCLLVQDGNFACTPVYDDIYDSYPPCDKNCDDLKTTMQNAASSYKLPDNCITGEKYYWSDNNPKAGVAQMKYGNCGGGYETGGSCDLKKEFKDKTACPVGTKPFFFTDKFDKRNSCDCGGGTPDLDCYNLVYQGHKPFYSNIQYVCCNENEFQISDDDFPEPSGLPKNMDYCYPTVYTVQGDNNNSSPASIIIGRDGSGANNDPTAKHDGCDIDENRGLGKLRTLLGNANNDTWRGNSDKC